MKIIEKGTWHSRVEEILCRDFGNLYGRLTEITQQMLLQCLKFLMVWGALGGTIF